MHADVEIGINYLWGDKKLSKSEWGPMNYLVGPNGTGKSTFLERLVEDLPRDRLKARYLSSDRLVNWTKREHLRLASSSFSGRGINFETFTSLKTADRKSGEINETFIILREQLNVQIKVEAKISQLLGRTVRLDESGGFLNPMITTRDSEYSFKENESHGIKELIALLTLLYDESYDCLIIDEPELHLHPQFQSLFLQEARMLAGDPLEGQGKKCFIIATHSPYIVDIRSIEDLRNVLLFHSSRHPTSIGILSSEDEYRIRTLLPRLNTHHKQFFFSTRPNFVEGYHDQQIYSLIQERRGIMGAGATTFIDVGGKDELDLFFRLCNQLEIDCQIISDLDSLFTGKLKESVARDDRCNNYLRESGGSLNFDRAWNDIILVIDKATSAFLAGHDKGQNPSIRLGKLHEAIESTEGWKRRYTFLIGVLKIPEELKTIIGSDDLTFIRGKLKTIIEACTKASIHILPQGQVENYMASDSSIENEFILTENAKSRLFVNERDFILSNDLDVAKIGDRYGDLIGLLDRATAARSTDSRPLIARHLRRFVFKVQESYRAGEIKAELDLKREPFSIYDSLLEVIEFRNERPNFMCRVRVRDSSTVIEFSHGENPWDIVPE